MTSIIYNRGKKAYGIENIVLNTEEELSTVNVKRLDFGTMVFIQSNSKYYKLNSKKEWIEVFPFNSVKSSGGSSDNIDGGEFDDSSYRIYDGGSIDNSDPI